MAGNTAPANSGGGIYAGSLFTPEVTLASNQIVTNNTGGNCAGDPIANCVG